MMRFIKQLTCNHEWTRHELHTINKYMVWKKCIKCHKRMIKVRNHPVSNFGGMKWVPLKEWHVAHIFRLWEDKLLKRRSI